MDLFNQEPLDNQCVAHPRLNVSIHRNVFGRQRSKELFDKLTLCDHWKQETIFIAGRDIPIPRLTAWYGDEGRGYSYSGIKLEPLPWKSDMLIIKEIVEEKSAMTFNSALLNMYRTGSDSVAWHADDEPELGEDPIIASLTFGATRTFKLKEVATGDVVDIPLENDMLLLMGSGVQKNWIHSIPKTKRSVGPRINITFRNILLSAENRTTVVSLSSGEPYDVYIGRPSKWGNPFSHLQDSKADVVVEDRADAVELFDKWIVQGEGKHLLNDLHELKGKRLGCWCKSGLPCHGHILARLADSLQ